MEEAGIDKNLALRARAAGDTDGEHLYDTRQWLLQCIAEALNVVDSIIVKDLRIVMSLACCILLIFAPATAAAQTRQYIWSDIDCRQSRIAAWPGLKCRATNVVTSEGNIGVFRQWAAFGTSRDGYYAHLFLWEAQNNFSYLSADETTADFVKGIFEYGKLIAAGLAGRPLQGCRLRDLQGWQGGPDLHRLPARGQTATRRIRRADGRHPLRTVGEDHH